MSTAGSQALRDGRGGIFVDKGIMKGMATVRVGVKGIARHGLRLKAVRLISLAEPELASVISQVENDSLFKKIRPLVQRLPFKTGGFYLRPLDEATAPAGYDPIPWSEHQREVELIRRLGQERFQRYFLSNDEGPTPEQPRRKNSPERR